MAIIGSPRPAMSCVLHAAALNIFLGVLAVQLRVWLDTGDVQRHDEAEYPEQVEDVHEKTNARCLMSGLDFAVVERKDNEVGAC